MACYEIGINPRTLAGRLKQGSIDPDTDGTYSTKQIIQAIYNDLESERIRELRSKSALNELELRRKEGELIDLEDFAKRYEPIFTNLVRIVKSSKMTEDEQNEILTAVTKLHEPG